MVARNMERNFQAGSSERPLSPMDPVQTLFAPFLLLILCCQVFGNTVSTIQHNNNTKKNPKNHKLQSLLYKDKVTLYNASCLQWNRGIGFFFIWIEKAVNQT